MSTKEVNFASGACLRGIANVARHVVDLQRLKG